jgi:hypothetical protein
MSGLYLNDYKSKNYDGRFCNKKQISHKIGKIIKLGNVAFVESLLEQALDN